MVRKTKGGPYVLQELDGIVMRLGVAAFRLMLYIARNEPLLRQLAQDVFLDESSVSGASSEESSVSSVSSNNSSI